MLPEKAPIVEINSSNIDQLWPCLLLVVRSSTFVAIDTEFSGLGCRKRLQAKNIEERYKSISEAAQTRSILSLGVSCFKFRGVKDPEDENGDKVFLVQTFNILTLCTENYTVESSSLQFLVEHGFDFNKQYSLGVKYHRGLKDEDMQKKEQPKTTRKSQPTFKPYMRLLMEELISNDIPIVLHNALLDIVFLYANFYGPLPHDLTTFVTDLHSMFRGGIFDTKVIAEFKMRMQASFLEYVYKRCLKENKRLARHKKSSVVVEFLKYPQGIERHLAWVDLTVPEAEDSGDMEGLQVLCQSFSNHGWCMDGIRCRNSHSVDLVLRNESHPMSKTKKQKLKQQQKKKQKEEGEEEEQPRQEDSEGNPTKKAKTEEENCEPEQKSCLNDNGPTTSPPADNGTHGAGFDAFMTGLAFSVFLTKYSKEPPTSSSEEGSNVKVDDDELKEGAEDRWSGWGSVPRDFANRVYLSGKDFSLQISRSAFARPSKVNLQKLQRLGKNG